MLSSQRKIFTIWNINNNLTLVLKRKRRLAFRFSGNEIASYPRLNRSDFYFANSKHYDYELWDLEFFLLIDLLLILILFCKSAYLYVLLHHSHVHSLIRIVYLVGHLRCDAQNRPIESVFADHHGLNHCAQWKMKTTAVERLHSHSSRSSIRWGRRAALQAAYKRGPTAACIYDESRSSCDSMPSSRTTSRNLNARWRIDVGKVWV